MKEKQRLVIILPNNMWELPVQIVRGSGCKKLVISVEPTEELSSTTAYDKHYAFIWRQNDYLKISLDELIWIEAAGSYSTLHLLGGKTMTISFHLAVIEEKLPQTDFMRIHRSYIVNLKHVISLIGNSLKLENQLLTIGREYRDKLLDRFIFLGVRRNKPNR